LSKEIKEFISMDLDLELSNTELAKRFGVTEGAIRYHKKKQIEKDMDGRKPRYSAVSQYSTAIEAWVQENLSQDHPKRNTILSLYRILKEFHNYNRSYDALRRFIRKHHPQLLQRAYSLRIETPPGKLSQIDWKEQVGVQLGAPDNWVKVNFFIFQLSFSRYPVILVRLNRDQQSFLSAHYHAVIQLGGVTEYIRSDCMKTAVKIWNGRASELNQDYQEFLNQLGVKGFPARPGTATDKGKVEKKIQDIFRNVEFRHLVFRDLEHLQEYINTQVAKHCERTICPATGTTIEEAFSYEYQFLNPVTQAIPEIPVETKITTVQKGNLAYFKGNYYQIPEGYAGKQIRCINSGTTISLYHQGRCLGVFSHEPALKGMVRMNKTAAIDSKQPMSNLVKNWWLEVSDRQLEYYQTITGESK
jgi:transposase